eukprot:CAMPEP_0197241700 /NCGR_PEP_ID=MMETSP1429-20130617/7669_1 /TAXON_ID=49237 /ORGANISM="Chaetoceros  sp., Strain UNC1202" /LENGTH=47 /DNA_ID= /DNA_START= /DNA_END= /DNA_ORIENTATION=
MARLAARVQKGHGNVFAGKVDHRRVAILVQFQRAIAFTKYGTAGPDD